MGMATLKYGVKLGEEERKGFRQKIRFASI
jgi:hypothetical protein